MRTGSFIGVFTSFWATRTSRSYATYLKIGTTALVLQALLNGAPPERLPRLADPLHALKSISHDRTWKWPCIVLAGKETSAIEVQRTYLQVVHAPFVSVAVRSLATLTNSAYRPSALRATAPEEPLPVVVGPAVLRLTSVTVSSPGRTGTHRPSRSCPSPSGRWRC